MKRLILAVVMLLSGGLNLVEVAGEPVPEPCELTVCVFGWSDEKIPQDGGLSFVLWDEQHNILQYVVNLRQYASFAPLRFTAAGRYIYFVSQDAGNCLATAHDPALYQVVVTVAEEAGRLRVQTVEYHQVCGDPLSETAIIRTLEKGEIPSFENHRRAESIFVCSTMLHTQLLSII